MPVKWTPVNLQIVSQVLDYCETSLADTQPALQLFWLAWGKNKVDVQQVLDAWR